MLHQRAMVLWLSVLGSTIAEKPTGAATPPPAMVIFVHVGATGANNGGNWADAYIDLHDALDQAALIASSATPVEIWVAEGVYKPDRGTGDRLGMYQVPPYVALYGGFAGIEATRTQRDWIAHPTILEGDLLNNDDLSFGPTSDCCSEHAEPGCADAACAAKVIPIYPRCGMATPPVPSWTAQCVDYAMQYCCDICRPSRCDNTYRILDVLDGDGVVIDGLIIQNGEASNFQMAPSNAPTSGGGIRVHAGAISVRNCLFAGNAASGSGSGSLSVASAAVIKLEWSTFADNESFTGINAILGTSSNGHSVVRDCIFTRNRGYGVGGGTALEVRRCIFIQNAGGGVSAGGVGTPLIADSLFIENTVSLRGTVDTFGRSADIVNCVFESNIGQGCTALSVAYGGRIVDCAFIGNVATAAGGPIACAGGFFGGSTLVNALFVDNRTESGGALSASPASIYNSIFWGNRDNDPGTTLQQEQIEPPGLNGFQQINYSIVEGWDGTLGGVGNSGVDPLFVDPIGPDMLPASGDENYRLSVNSPAINSGHPNPPLLAVRDLDGHHRTLCASTDLGPYEWGIADPNCDGLVDLSDYSLLPACLTGPDAAAIPVSCHPFDFDANDAVDLSDVARFQQSMGP